MVIDVAAVTATGAAGGAGGAAGAEGRAGAPGLVVRATVRVSGVCPDPEVPVAVTPPIGMSIRSWTRSLICAVTTCMRCVSSPVSSCVSCCVAVCSARTLLVYV